MADVRITDEAFEQLENSPRVVRERVAKIVNRLELWPTVSGVRALAGVLAGWYRIRTGDYRIRFFVKGEIVTIDKIGHRKDIYDD